MDERVQEHLTNRSSAGEVKSNTDEAGDFFHVTTDITAEQALDHLTLELVINLMLRRQFTQWHMVFDERDLAGGFVVMRRRDAAVSAAQTG